MERGEALQITLLKPLWFHTGGKVVLILEENGGTEILQLTFPRSSANSDQESSSGLLVPETMI